MNVMYRNIHRGYHMGGGMSNVLANMALSRVFWFNDVMWSIYRATSTAENAAASLEAWADSALSRATAAEAVKSCIQ